MRSRSLLAAAALPLVLPLVLLAGCSGDDEPGKDEPAANPTEEARTACAAEVEITGAHEQSWSGEGFVVTENRSGPVLYRAEDEKTVLTVLSGDDSFPAVVQLRVGQKSWSGDDGTIEAASDGSGATVETAADGARGSVDIAATIDC